MHVIQYTRWLCYETAQAEGQGGDGHVSNRLTQQAGLEHSNPAPYKDGPLGHNLCALPPNESVFLGLGPGAKPEFMLTV